MRAFNTCTTDTGNFLKAKKDTAIAIKAVTGKLAAAYYTVLTKGIEYVEEGTKKYQQQIQSREVAVISNAENFTHAQFPISRDNSQRGSTSESNCYLTINFLR